jgi:hypothetical protein
MTQITPIELICVIIIRNLYTRRLEMMKKRSSTYFKLWVSLIVVFIALGLTFVACKPTKQAEEQVTEPIPAPVEEAPAVVSGKTTFKWIPRKAGVKVAEIPLGKSVVCPFEFGINDPAVSKVNFSIKDDKLAQLGIVIAEEEVAVTEGKAASDAMFGITPGTRLGDYELAIVAKNAETGEIIGEGVIPFKVLPKGAGGC